MLMKQPKNELVLLTKLAAMQPGLVHRCLPKARLLVLFHRAMLPFLCWEGREEGFNLSGTAHINSMLPDPGLETDKKILGSHMPQGPSFMH